MINLVASFIFSHVAALTADHLMALTVIGVLLAVVVICWAVPSLFAMFPHEVIAATGVLLAIAVYLVLTWQVGELQGELNKCREAPKAQTAAIVAISHQGQVATAAAGAAVAKVQLPKAQKTAAALLARSRGKLNACDAADKLMRENIQ